MVDVHVDEETLVVNETPAVADETRVVEETEAGLLLEPNKSTGKILNNPRKYPRLSQYPKSTIYRHARITLDELFVRPKEPNE